MQFSLSPAELKLLADILMNQECPPHLLNQVLERRLQLDCEELDRLREILLEHNRKLAEQAKAGNDATGKQKSEAEQRLLSSMMDKVTEACAML